MVVAFESFDEGAADQGTDGEAEFGQGGEHCDGGDNSRPDAIEEAGHRACLLLAHLRAARARFGDIDQA